MNNVHRVYLIYTSFNEKPFFVGSLEKKGTKIVIKIIPEKKREKKKEKRGV